VALAASVAMLANLSRAQLVMYVDDDAPSGGTGLSWSSPFRHLQDALAVAPTNTVIRIAGGTHRPDEGAGQVALLPWSTFQLNRKLALYGGYRGLAGGGSPNDRDPQQFVTVLSGDLAQNSPVSWDNCLHVVTVNTSSTVTVDGLEIVDGGGTIFSPPTQPSIRGGGMVLTQGTVQLVDLRFRRCNSLGWAVASIGTTIEFVRCNFGDDASPMGNGALHLESSNVRVEDCSFVAQPNSAAQGIWSNFSSLDVLGSTFRGNHGTDGGSVRSFGAPVVISDCVFENSRSQNSHGGAVLVNNGPLTMLRCQVRGTLTDLFQSGAVYVNNGSLVMDECDFEDNVAGDGGGVAVTSSVFSITRCEFRGNVADAQGSGGALWANGSGVVSRCSFVDNRAWSRGGAVAWSQGNGALSYLDRCTFFGNWADSAGSAVYFDGSLGGGIRSSILWDNRIGMLSTLDAQAVATQGPLVVTYSDVQGTLVPGAGNLNVDPQFLSVTSRDERLAAGSPCIDAGDPAFTDPDGSRADMGAWPFDPLACPQVTAYCVTAASSSGCLTTLSWQGNPSATAATPFVVTASNAEGGKQGMLFYGINGAVSAPFGATVSTRCVATPTQRTSTQSTGGTPAACDGSLSLDWNAYLATHPAALGAPFALGDTVWMQAWIRDPAGPGTTYLSDALQFSHCY
jgi:hypothetical protein